MDKRELHNITLGKFKSFFPEASSVGLGDDFYILDAQLTDNHSPLHGHSIPLESKVRKDKDFAFTAGARKRNCCLVGPQYTISGKNDSIAFPSLFLISGLFREHQ